MAKDRNRRKLGEHQELLPVKLTDVEMLDRARQIGHVHHALALHEAEMAELRHKMKAKETELSETRDRLASVLLVGAESRPVTVEAWANYATGKFEELRADTGEVINRRALRPEEKQGDLGLMSGAARQMRLAEQEADEEQARASA